MIEDEQSDSDDVYTEPGFGSNTEDDNVGTKDRRDRGNGSMNNAARSVQTETFDSSSNTRAQLSETQNILVSAAAKYALLCGLTILFVNVQFCVKLYSI